MDDVEHVRPSAQRAAVIALGVGAPVVLAVLVLCLALTDGSVWSLPLAALSYLLAWLRASRLSVVAGPEQLTVRNFYGRAVVRREFAEHVEPFSYRANPNFTCLAIKSRNKRWPMHATALADKQDSYESDARDLAAKLGMSLRNV